MYKIFVFLLLGLLIKANTYAQNTVDFRLAEPKGKVAESLYRNISIIDKRNDTTNMGNLKTGFFDRKTIVVTKVPLSTQFSRYFYKAFDTLNKKNVMALLLRKSIFNVINVGSRDLGTFSFRAALFEVKENKYLLIRSIDTIFSATSAMTVTTKLLDTSNAIMRGFIDANATVSGNGSEYSYNDILHIDSVEKLNIKLYTTPAYVDGLYLTYKTFKYQTPDKQITVESGDVENGTVKTTDAGGETQKVKPQKVYAIVYNGKPYISSRGRYYLLKKENNEFYFTGEVQVSSGVGNMILSSGGFGVLGAMAASGGSEATYYVKLDYINGSFIPIKKIDEPAPVPVNTGD